MITRREALRIVGLSAAAVAAAPTIVTAQPAPAPAGPFKLPPLPYPADALEPHVDARTMEIHHDKHHATYVANLNKAVADFPALQQKSVEELVRDVSAVPEPIRNAVRNNGGGHLNHSLFWQMMAKAGSEPRGPLAEAITKTFGSLTTFKENLAKAGLGQFGSGWAWLVLDGKDLKLEASANQDSPWMQGRHLLLGVDVWEHAYYLKYQNRRADYLTAWMNVVNWDFVNDRYQKALRS